MKTFRDIREEFEIPAIGQTLSRDLMPQIDSAFLKYLKKHDISFRKRQLNTQDLRSTQSEFDNLKILSLMSQEKDVDPIFVSNDNYVLDGHHRWIADHNTDGQTQAYVIDLPILELLRMAKEYESQLKEEITHKDFGPMMDSFVSFASEKLGIKSLPKVNFKNDNDQGEHPSFGGYNPHSNEIVIQTKNRHPMDVFRTLAHELVHHKQNEDGRIKDVAKEGSTGSPIEDEANSQAGILMRLFGKSNPDKFALSHIVEDINEEFSQSFKDDPHNREWGTDSLRSIYSEETPGQSQMKKKIRLVRKKEIEENSDGLGPTYGNKYSGSGLGSGMHFSAPISEAKSISQLREAWEAIAGRDMSTVGSGIDQKKIEETEIVDFSKKKEERDIGNFAKDLAGRVKERVKAQQKLVSKYKDDGKFDFDVGDRFSTPFTRERNEPPYKVVGHYVDVPRKDGPTKHGYYVERKYGENADDVERHKITIHDGETHYGAGFQKIGSLKTIKEEKPGLWANIRARRASGKRMRRKGEKGAPTEEQLRKAAGLDEDWQKVNRKDNTDGLSQKAVNAYRRENPGSKLKTAVTEKNPSGKRAKRRLSFCRRMSGMKKRLTSAETARDPDSRINKALRRWNCEE
jgi:hypothetical protein